MLTLPFQMSDIAVGNHREGQSETHQGPTGFLEAVIASLLKQVRLHSGNKICNQNTQTVSRTPSKPNVLEGHNVFWGLVHDFSLIQSPVLPGLGQALSCTKSVTTERKKPFALNVVPAQQRNKSSGKFHAASIAAATFSGMLPSYGLRGLEGPVAASSFFWMSQVTDIERTHAHLWTPLIGWVTLRNCWTSLLFSLSTKWI